MEHTCLASKRKLFSKIGFTLSVILVITAGLQLVLAVSLHALNVSSGFLSSWGLWFITFVPLYLVAVPVGLLLFRRLPRESVPMHPLRAGHFLTLLIICFPLMYGGSFLGTFLSGILSGGSAENALLNYTFDSNPVKLLVMVVLAPAIEEYVFRRQLLDRTLKYGEKTAIFFSAFTFALFHMNLYQFFYALGIGLILAYVYARTGRFRYPFLMHAIINFLGSAVAPWLLSRIDMDALRAVPSPDVLIAAPGLLSGLLLFGLYSLLLISLSIAGLILLFLQARHAIFRPAAEELPKGRRLSTVYLNPGMVLYLLLCLAMIIYALF